MNTITPNNQVQVLFGNKKQPKDADGLRQNLTAPPSAVVSKPAQVSGEQARVYFGIAASKDPVLAIAQKSMDVENRVKIISGTEYLAAVREKPRLVRNAMQDMVDMILSRGREQVVDPDGTKYHEYKFFSDHENPKYRIYANHRPITQLVDSSLAAAQGMSTQNRVIAFHGPVGSAKTTIVKAIIKGLEAWSRKEEGERYTLAFDVTDVMNEPEFQGDQTFLSIETEIIDGRHYINTPIGIEDPIMVLSKEARAELSGELNKTLVAEAEASNKRLRYKVDAKQEMDLSPPMRVILDKLLKKNDNDLAVVMDKHVRAKLVYIDEQARIGVADSRPKGSEMSEDDKELTGDTDLRKLMEIGKDSDPWAHGHDGAFARANGGILFFDEFFKRPDIIKRPLLQTAQERAYAPAKFPSMPFNGVIFATTNPKEWTDFKANEGNIPMLDRIIDIDVPYASQVNDELKIYDKEVLKKATDGQVDFIPWLVEGAARWTIGTRIDMDNNKTQFDWMDLVKVYNGEGVPGWTASSLKQLKKDNGPEAQDFYMGISTRFTADALSTSASKPEVIDEDEGTGTVTPNLVFNAIAEELDQRASELGKEKLEHYKQMLDDTEEWTITKIVADVNKALVADDDALQNLFDNYIREIRAWSKKAQVEDEAGDLREPDAKLMRGIEENMDIHESRAEDYRRELLIAIGDPEVKFDFTKNERLYKAVQEYYVEYHSVSSKALPNPRSKNQEDQRTISLLKERLIASGYSTVGADYAINKAYSPDYRGVGTGDND